MGTVYHASSTAEKLGQISASAAHTLVQYSSPQCLTHPCLDKGITTARLLAKGLLGAKYDKDALNETSKLPPEDKVLAAYVDCSKKWSTEKTCVEHEITAYPTIKLISHVPRAAASEMANSIDEKVLPFAPLSKVDERIPAILREYRGSREPEAVVSWAMRRVRPETVVKVLSVGTSKDEVPKRPAGEAARVLIVATVPPPTSLAAEDDSGGSVEWPSWHERYFVDAAIDFVSYEADLVQDAVEFLVVREEGADPEVDEGAVSAHFASADPRAPVRFEVEPIVRYVDDTHGYSENALRRFFRQTAWPLVWPLTDEHSHAELMEALGGGSGVQGERAVLVVLMPGKAGKAASGEMASDAELAALAADVSAAALQRSVASSPSIAARREAAAERNGISPATGLRVATLTPDAPVVASIAAYCKMEEALASGKPAARLVDMRDMRVYGDITSDSSAVSAVKLRSLASAFLAGDMEPEAALSGGLHFERVEAAAAAGGEKEEL